MSKTKFDVFCVNLLTSPLKFGHQSFTLIKTHIISARYNTEPFIPRLRVWTPIFPFFLSYQRGSTVYILSEGKETTSWYSLVSQNIQLMACGHSNKMTTNLSLNVWEEPGDEIGIKLSLSRPLNRSILVSGNRTFVQFLELTKKERGLWNSQGTHMRSAVLVLSLLSSCWWLWSFRYVAISWTYLSIWILALFVTTVRFSRHFAKLGTVMKPVGCSQDLILTSPPLTQGISLHSEVNFCINNNKLGEFLLL